MFPHTGPSEGHGIIHFYGAGFRDDFALADVGCNVGGAIGKGKVVSEDEITCVVEEMPLVEEGSVLDATVALNSYSWPPANSNTTYVPYGVQGVFPTMGPYAGGTDILVTGKGFDVDAEKPLCKFGTDADFAIVEGQVLSYDKMVCRSPAEFKLPSNADSLLTVPIGVAFNEQDFEPFTESLHRFRFYNPPNLVAVDPDEVDVGKIIEVYVFADENSEFFEPLPSAEGTASQYGIECNFGRFGNGQGMFVNRTTIKCITPSVQEDPEDIWRETVKLTVALNGQDFDEDNSDLDFSFVGSGSTLAFWPWVLGTLLVGLLLVALVVFCSALLNMANVNNIVKRPVSRQRPHVIRDAYEQISSRAYSRGFMGQRAGSAAQ